MAQHLAIPALAQHIRNCSIFRPFIGQFFVNSDSFFICQFFKSVFSHILFQKLFRIVRTCAGLCELELCGCNASSCGPCLRLPPLCFAPALCTKNMLRTFTMLIFEHLSLHLRTFTPKKETFTMPQGDVACSGAVEKLSSRLQ